MSTRGVLAVNHGNVSNEHDDESEFNKDKDSFLVFLFVDQSKFLASLGPSVI